MRHTKVTRRFILPLSACDITEAIGAFSYGAVLLLDAGSALDYGSSKGGCPTNANGSQFKSDACPRSLHGAVLLNFRSHPGAGDGKKKLWPLILLARMRRGAPDL